MKKSLALASIFAATMPSLAFAAEDCSKPGVLTKCTVNGSLSDYITAVLRDNMGYVMLVAIILIVFFGVQYMLAMGQPSAQGAAKQRIAGVLGGLIFYFLITYLQTLLGI